MSEICFESYKDFALAVKSVLPTAGIDVLDDGQLIIYTDLMEDDNENIVAWTDEG